MKKLLFIVAISLLCFACSEDDPQELFIKISEIVLYPKDEIPIDAVSDFDITYLSGNTYLANVSVTGLISANKVGNTLVEVSSHDRVVEVPIEIKGRYNLYPDPITDWDISNIDLIKIIGEPNKSYSSSVQYDNYSEQAPSIAYLFTSGDSLMAVLVMVLDTYFDDLVGYLGERFVYNSEEDGLLIFRNANKEEDASTVMGVFSGTGSSLMVLYIKNQNYKTKSRQSVVTDLKKMRKHIETQISEHMNQIE